MTENEAQVLPYLFATLFGFILVNLIVSLCLFFFSKIENLKALIWYWSSLLLVYTAQGHFQNVEFSIMVVFGLNVLPVMIISKILFDSLEKKFPFKEFFIIWIVGMGASVLLKSLNFEFRVAAFPMCLALAIIFFIPGIDALFVQRKRASVLKKFMGFIYILGGIHLINFALFRMVPGNQIVGFGTAIALYQILSISLLAFAFEEYSKKEKLRLQDLVIQRTEELTKSLRVKDILFKVVLHDIANPVQGQIWMLEKLKRSNEMDFETLKKISRLSHLIKDVIQQVRSSEAIKSGDLNLLLTPVNLQQCLDDLHLIFEAPLTEKGLKLVTKNELPAGTFFMADQNSFTTSVMCNLISNSIKFSAENEMLEIRASLKGEKIVIEVEDRGIGMPQDMTLGMFDPTKKNSRPGTLGERGTGYGMPLVKSFLDYFGGEIEVESRPMDAFPLDHGTKITLTMEQSLGH